MRKRPQRPARSFGSAAALLAIAFLATIRPALADDDDRPAAVSTIAVDSTASSDTNDAVMLLDAERSGDLAVSIRGTGEADHVRLAVRNNSNRRLNVVIPPGLIASAGTGQAFQSMGLGLPTSNPGRFGSVSRVTTDTAGFRSLPVDSAFGIMLDPGQDTRFDLPSVCLNFGVPTPKPSNQFRLVSVEEYTNDPRARKALKSLATLGTSQGVAQAVVWHVFNGMTAGEMSRSARQYLNDPEISAAARFIEVLDASGTEGLVDADSLQRDRVLARVRGEGDAAGLAVRLGSELQGSKLLGLPARVIDEVRPTDSRPSTLLVDLQLAPEADGNVFVRADLRRHSLSNGWTRAGAVEVGRFPASDLSGERLAEAVDRAIAAKFVAVTSTSRGPGLRIANRLPLTLEGLVIRAGDSDEAPELSINGLGVGPGRSGTVAAPSSTLIVESVILGGL